MFTLCALFYGDHPDYAKRCLDSLLRSEYADFVKDFRFGLNAVSAATRSLIMDAARALAARRPVLLFEAEDGRNVGKYPLMRTMFYDSASPALGDFLMWFDDDSALTDGSQAWWRKVLKALAPPSHVLIGGRCFLKSPFRKGQEDGMRRQPWYTGKPFLAKPEFITGGWWAAKTDFITLWRYPFPEIHHNGGDSVLGEVCRQQNKPVVNFRDGLLINSAMVTPKFSNALRRGLDNQYWPWQKGAPPAPPLPPIIVRTLGGL